MAPALPTPRAAVRAARRSMARGRRAPPRRERPRTAHAHRARRARDVATLPGHMVCRSNLQRSQRAGRLPHPCAHDDRIQQLVAAPRSSQFHRSERFDPDRFLPDRASAIRSGAYLPFGAGVHMCIGSGFALTEARLILAAMVQHFTIRANPHFPVRPWPGMTLGMRHPFAVIPTRAQPPTQPARASAR